MRIQPDYATTTKQHRFPKDAGIAGRPGATRWYMRSSNGSEWTTRGYYTRGEAMQFLGAEPLGPIVDAQTAREIVLGKMCISLYLDSHNSFQGQLHYAGMDGEWEWYFWD